MTAARGGVGGVVVAGPRTPRGRAALRAAARAVGAGSVPGEEIGPHSDAERVDETRTESRAQDAGAAGTLSMVVDAPTPTPTTPNPGAKKQRNSKPKRMDLELQPGENVHETRTPVDERSGRRNKLGVCYHKPSNKWRAIVYMQRKQVNLGYFATREDSERQVALARKSVSYTHLTLPTILLV